MPPSLAATGATHLADYTSRDLIIPELHGRDAPTVIQELTQALHAAGRVKDLLAFFHAALNMESLHSSAMDYGIAFPHARVPDVETVCFALGRSPVPIGWRDGPDIRHIQMVFLMALPTDESADYISVVLSIGHLHTDRAIMSQLLNSRSADEMLAALRSIPLQPAVIR